MGITLLISCVTTPVRTELPDPAAPAVPDIQFQYIDGGAWLSEEDYKELLNYLLESNQYQEELKLQIKYYKGGLKK